MSGAGRLVGQSVLRTEDPKLLTGRATFVADLEPRGTLHAAFVRSPLPHARILGVGTEAALAVPGVVDVLTADGLGARERPLRIAVPIPGYASPVFLALADGTARHVGDPIAIVVASSRYTAEDGCDQVELDLEPLPPVASVESALDPSSAQLFADVPGNRIFHDVQEYGDPDTPFTRAALVVARTFRQQRQAIVPMETRGVLASYDPATGALAVWSSTQRPHGLRLELAEALRLPLNRIRVISPHVGGGFGGKISTYREDIAVCLASMRLGRPVKWIEDRFESLTAGGQSRDDLLELEAAADDRGVITGLRARFTLDHGAYPAIPIPGSSFGKIVRVLLPGALRGLQGYRYEHTAVATCKASYVAYRGPWAVETWAREALLDEIARGLGLDPFEVRRRNLVGLEDQPRRMITGPTLSGVTVRDTLERAAELVDLYAFRAEQAAARAEGRLLGLGVASMIEAAPGPPDYMEAASLPATPEPARVHLEPDGRVTVYTGQNPHGQGHETTLAQVVADELSLPLEHVSVVYGDTASAPFHRMGTAGSRAATFGNGGALLAARKVRAKILDVASHLVEIAADDLELSDGHIVGKGAPSLRIPLAEVAARAAHLPAGIPGLEAGGIEATAAVTALPGGWSQATHCAVVEVDAATGLVRIRRYLVVGDCGTIINPAIVEGQIRGGVAQGIGSVLLEHAVYDDDAQIRSGTFLDYLLPTLADMPAIEIEHLESAPQGEINFRGVGEGGAICAPAALANALADALGAMPTARPVTPTMVLELLGSIEPE